MEILNFFSELAKSEQRTAGLPTPSVISRLWGTRKVNNQVPMLRGTGQRKRVVGMKQQDSQACPPPTGTRPSIRRTRYSRRGEDLSAVAT
jgi:hypothetical protein